MAENISLSVFGTFGNPNGFKQTFSGQEYNIKLFDLNPNAVQIFQNSVLFAIRKEIVDDNSIISFIKYSFAQEQGSSRGGTFVGASVICANGVPDLEQTANVLNQLHHNLVSNPHNIQNGIIKVKHSNEFNVDAPRDYEKLKIDSSEISDIDFNEKNRSALVYIMKNVAELFRKSLDLLNVYDTIYFTQDSEVAEYVIKKGLFDLLEKDKFSEKINQLESQKMAHQNKELEKLNKRIDQFKKEATKNTSEYLEIINKNKKTHQENAEKIEKSEKEYKALFSKYKEGVEKFEGYKTKFSHGRLKRKQLNALLAAFNQDLNNFNQEKSQFSKPKEINTVSEERKPFRDNSTITNRREGSYDSQIFSEFKEKHYERGFNSRGLDIKKLIVVGFLAFVIVGLGFLAYKIFSKSENNQTVNNTRMSKHNEHQEINNENEETLSLEPKPNGYLSKKDLKLTIKKQFQNLPMHKDEVVNGILNVNPTDIGETYKGKEKAYGEYLINENEDLFENDSLIKTEGLKIPFFKRELNINNKNSNEDEKKAISTVDDIQHR